MEFVAPLFHGSGEESLFTDMPVLRDTRGLPFISGGALAAAFHRAQPGHPSEWLGLDSKGEPVPSRILFDDAFPVPEQRQTLAHIVETRKRVSIERHSATAIEGAHFDLEVLPVGSIFLFSCRCDAADKTEAERMRNAMESFLAAGGILGGKTNSGLGRWQAQGWTHQQYDLDDKDDLKQWLLEGHGLAWEGKTDVFNPWQAFSAPKPPGWTITFNVNISQGVHLSSAGKGLPVSKQPDEYQAVRKRITPDGTLLEECVDYGTTIRGRIRTVMEMLLRTYLIWAKVPSEEVLKLIPCDPRQKAGLEEVANFLGFPQPKKGAKTQDCRAKWSVQEHNWQSPACMKMDHNRLDHFVQHAMEGPLFCFAPLSAGQSEVVIELDKDAPSWQKLLLIHAVRLLELNILPWGGKGARGYLGARISDIKCVEPDDTTALATEINKWAEKLKKNPVST